jgi:uncharacterized protein with PIN domain
VGRLDEIKFFCDAMLGKLGRWLRILGYDTLVADKCTSDTTILLICRIDNRYLLTRDKELGRYGVYIDSQNLAEQLSQVFSLFNLKIKSPRCPLCNSELVPAEHPLGFKNTFQCLLCGKYYWRGSHWKRIMKTISETYNKTHGLI